jgi:hypothetical protein
MLQLSMKCWSLTFNAQGSKLIVILVQLRTMKNENICNNNGSVQGKKKQDEIQFTTKIDGFLNFISYWMLMYFFTGLKKKFTLCMTKFKVLVFCFSYFMDNSDVNKMLDFTFYFKL